MSKETYDGMENSSTFQNKTIDKLVMYNMGHGDSFLAYRENDNQTHICQTLIDCGSRSRKNKLQKLVISELEIDLNRLIRSDNPQRSWIISHLHDDHINCIQDLGTVKFNNVYLPNFFTSKDIEILLQALVIFSRIDPMYKYALDLLYLIPNIISHLDSGTNIFFVSFGNFISEVGVYEVLWPIKNKMYEMVEKSEGEVYPNVIDLAETFEKMIDLILVDDNGHKRVVFDKDSLGVFENKFEQFKIDLEDRILRKKEIFTPFRGTKEKFSEFLNSTSLVMFENDKKALFTGDIPETIYTSNIFPLMATKTTTINYLKIPHHASISHFCASLPVSKISFLTEKKHSKYIDSRYFSYSNFGIAYICDNPRAKIKPIMPLHVNTVRIKHTFDY